MTKFTAAEQGTLAVAIISSSLFFGAAASVIGNIEVESKIVCSAKYAGQPEQEQGKCFRFAETVGDKFVSFILD